MFLPSNNFFTTLAMERVGIRSGWEFPLLYHLLIENSITGTNLAFGQLLVLST